MRRPALAVLATLAIAGLAGCGGSGDRTASFGGATVTISADVDSIRGELTVVLEQFPYQRWYAACVEKRFASTITPGDEEALSNLPDGAREAKVNQIIGDIGPACEATSERPLIDPNATSQELDLIRTELVSYATDVARSKSLDPSRTECVTRAFKKLPDRYIVEFGNSDLTHRRAILLTVFKTCAETD